MRAIPRFLAPSILKSSQRGKFAPEPNEVLFDDLLLRANEQQAQIYQEKCPDMQCRSINVIAQTDGIRVLRFGVSPGLYTQCQHDTVLMDKLKNVTQLLSNAVTGTQELLKDATASFYLPKHSSKR
ncbi:hypothetical protein [Lacticaseibacillus paracasei]|uniref:hypothetical protein n=1 Tax=Lacticaseibacillus paracasei TaxID=1597 RepID=UPI001E545A60|nr:hypothetical protein [Lacticaseibacillus paracasei]